jgi:glycerol-3-phosphate cytidylyltransferase
MVYRMHKVKGYTGGVFDLLHEGHLNLLRRARKLCDYLVVGIQADEEVVKMKPRPILNTQERVRQMEAIGIADEVIVYYDGQKPDTLKKVKPDLFIHGIDWEEQTDRSEVLKYMEEQNIKKILLPRTEGISTSEILKRIKNVR